MSLAGEVGVAGEEDSVWVYVGLLAGIAEAGVVVAEVKVVIVEKSSRNSRIMSSRKGG